MRLCLAPPQPMTKPLMLHKTKLIRPSKTQFCALQMIVEPELRVPDFAKAGADIISVHAETAATIHLHRTINQIKEAGCLAGAVLNPGTSLRAIEEVLDMLDLVLVMSVNPGFGGQKFINSQVEKIKQLRKMCNDRVRPRSIFEPVVCRLEHEICVLRVPKSVRVAWWAGSGPAHPERIHMTVFCSSCTESSSSSASDIAIHSANV